MDILVFLFGLTIGIRHGIDLDHIAAITDITSAQPNRKRGIWYALLYGIGHAIVVLVLGVMLIAIGQKLPETVAMFFEKIVGITLILLGFYVLYSLFRYGKNFKVKSRWMLVFDAIQFGYHKLLHNFDLAHEHPKQKEHRYKSKSAFAVGMIHGVGAETPTQITALAALLGIGGGIKSIMFLFFFVAGILLSNMVLALFSSWIMSGARRWKVVYMIVGLLTAMFSLTVGISFLW